MSQCKAKLSMEFDDESIGFSYLCQLSSGHEGRHRWTGYEGYEDVEISWQEKEERTE